MTNPRKNTDFQRASEIIDCGMKVGEVGKHSPYLLVSVGVLSDSIRAVVRDALVESRVSFKGVRDIDPRWHDEASVFEEMIVVRLVRELILGSNQLKKAGGEPEIVKDGIVDRRAPNGVR
jgi:hypothetical protein